jgi:cytochrome c peroxidase
MTIRLLAAAVLGVLAGSALPGRPQEPRPAQNGHADVPRRADTSFAPVALKEDFKGIFSRLSATKPDVMKRQQALLEERYDLADRPSKSGTMFRGKPLQEGPRARLPQGQTWTSLSQLSPAEVRSRDLFPKGFLPLPHAFHEQGGMVFPKVHIDAVKKEEGRDLARFDVDYDLPERFLPEFPPPMFLTTRPDLGDVSQGRLVTINNFYELFNGIVTPKTLDGLRLLLTPFNQQQFNATEDRRSEQPSRGVTCFECHVNGHTNATFHLSPDVRPQTHRRRIDTPSLRGVGIQRLFGSQRALKTVEDFTEFEQRGAYFDGDHVIAAKKGLNVLDRGTQVQNMAEFQEFLDFPPAPKLGWDGRLDPKKAGEAELRGQEIFFGKGRCAACHVPPYYTDNLMHDLPTARFHTPRLINGRWAEMEGPIKTFPLRGIKDSPPYLHDGRLLTLEDAVEFFNLVLELRLAEAEKKDLVEFLKAL